ncbi:MAG: hypothetical protein J5589_00310 [Firmicutes bacterium]|nr:hypothetical protein [Bacillota bacterium]
MKKLKIVLSPEWGEFQQMETVNAMLVEEWYEPIEAAPKDVAASSAAVAATADAVSTSKTPLFCFPDIAFGGRCPFPEWDELYLEDAAGPLPYEIRPIPTLDDNMMFRGIFPERPAEGTIHVRYRIFPRILPEGYRRSPCFDFRAEPNGLNGTGLFSLVLPYSEDEKEKMETALSWDLSRLPEGSRAIFSLSKPSCAEGKVLGEGEIRGEGDVLGEYTRKDLADTMFAVGRMQAFEKDGLGVYWFLNPPFDIRGIAEKILPIFRYEKNYFEDPSAGFRVLLRRDPFTPSGAGSACPYAFISTYSALDTPEDFAGNEEKWIDVFIHEMTHTWPAMEDQTTGDGTWFCEGATEYYCTMIPYWGGFASAEETSRKIRRKIVEDYLENPYREMPNSEIPKIQWQDLRAQHVPYGRGMLYIARTEAKLREKGKGSILEIVKKHSITDPMTRQEWKDFIFEKLGQEGLDDFHDMEEGRIPSFEPDLFGPEIRI